MAAVLDADWLTQYVATTLSAVRLWFLALVCCQKLALKWRGIISYFKIGHYRVEW